MKKLIILNGPPRCGKNTFASMLQANTWKYTDFKAQIMSFATPLKLATHALYGIEDNGSEDFFEEVKDQERDEFFGQTPRQAYIKMSEQQVKPVLGKNFFGEVMVNKILATKADTVVITDCGFVDELGPITDNIPLDKIILVHIEREGCTYVNDSRTYVDLDGVECIRIINTCKKQLEQDAKLLIQRTLLSVDKVA